MQRRLLILTSFLMVTLTGPGLRTGWAGDAPWLSKGGSFDACFLQEKQKLNREPLSNITIGHYRGAEVNNWDVIAGCLRTNVDFDLSGDLSLGYPTGRLKWTLQYDYFSQNSQGRQGQFKFKEKKDPEHPIKFAHKMIKAPAGYNWTQYIRMDHQQGTRYLNLGWGAKSNGTGRANDFVACGASVIGFNPIITFNRNAAAEQLKATLLAQAKAEIEALADLEHQVP